jgi:hypothetical protein
VREDKLDVRNVLWWNALPRRTDTGVRDGGEVGAGAVGRDSNRLPERPERATQDEVRAACGCRPWDVSDVIYVLKERPLNLAGPGADRREMGVESSEFVAADRSELVEEIVSELQTRGVPSGAWLLDLAKVRQSLREADNLMRRLEDAIIRSSAAAPLDEL